MIAKTRYNIFVFIFLYMLLILFLYFTSYKFFINDFLKIEEEQNKNNVNTILNILNQNIDNLKKTANDYSKWDESYQFIIDKNEEYIYDNFREGTTTLKDLNIDVIIYHTIKNEIIFSKYLDNYNDNEKKQLNDFILNKYQNIQEISTIINFNSKIYYYSKSSILKSDNSGDIKGFITVIKHLDLSNLNDTQAIFKTIKFNNEQTKDFTFEIKLENIPNAKILVNESNEQLTNLIQLFDLGKDYIITLEFQNFRELVLNSKKTIYIFNISWSIILLIIFYFIYKNQYLIENQNRLLNEEVEKKTNELNLAFRDLKNKNEELFTIANIDVLTKIKNRRSFFINSEEKLIQSIKEKKELSILIIDIDHFKSVNDNYGHSTGDKVLIEFSKIVSSLLDKNCIFGRIGGEEFCITFFDKSIEEVEIISESIRKKCEASIIEIENKNISFTVSMGLSSREDETNIDKIINDADQLLYKAKNSGRNRLIRATK